ncbi:MAG: two-component system, OmpR family, sensor histidine kinase MtrB [Ilumatobacteraceae bacterium]|nr:two-component system, OmpR family, sensor histidine kinase MtrB [Ilumatobacteraceae bacterium]
MTLSSDSIGTEPRRGLARGVVGRFASWRPARFGLRTRIMSMFIIGALLLSTFLAAVAYSFTRSSLLNQRERSSTDQAYRNARVAQREISTANTSANTIIAGLQQAGVTQAAININGAWASPSAKFTSDVIPAAMQARVIRDRIPAKMIIVFDKVPTLVIGIPLDSSNASYFEFADLADANSTLRNVGLSLLFGGMITTLAGAVTGMLAAKRAIRPLGDAAQAAKAIAGGRLDTRLEDTDDHDLQLLSTAFNDMAEALQNRVERDARFASDVSHELRSPLMTLAASVEVMQARRDDMPERAQAALDLLVADVARFQGLVEDLLEISRFDAGAIRLHLEDLLVAEFVRQAVAVSSLPTTKVTVTDRAEGLIMRGDRRRLARVVANLIDNARVHGGGEPAIIVTEAEGEGEPLAHVWIAVEDQGPGIPLEERSLVFERFARGAVAGRRSSSDGAGLGLALVDEHVRMHGGRVWVEDRSDGEPGARFVLELPAEEVAIG